MSTKSSIAYGPAFHFYREALDDDFIYLELEGVQYEAAYNRVMVPIPVHIWEFIRRYRVVDFSFADKSDEEIQRYVEREIDERIRKYNEAPEDRRGFISFFGSLVYGLASDDRVEQVARGIEHFKARRKHQREIREEIGKLEESNRGWTQDTLDDERQSAP
jgi:hypothetical protein